MKLRRLQVKYYRSRKWLERPVNKLMTALAAIGFILALILFFEANDPSLTFAIVLLSWGCFSVPIGMVAGNIISGMSTAERDHNDQL